MQRSIFCFDNYTPIATSNIDFIHRRKSHTRQQQNPLLNSPTNSPPDSSKAKKRSITMPSVKNPNGPSKNRLAARAAKARKTSAKQLSRKTREQQHKITKADASRGARAGLLPTSGPNKAVSAKKARKLERKMGYALRRKMEAEGEVEMKDVSETKEQKKGKQETSEDDMTVDTDNIS
ncbi:hypothetical protein RRF57_011402 [Xylaria bambusicola]|uniref:Uncharacterized protein n=1 Tax=Xylaria bambusicola TaxID=326684 RepID=A0AAN7Z3M4_9PEZI